MSEDPARVEGSSPARAGEAVRQLICRTRQITRRKFPAEEKIRVKNSRALDKGEYWKEGSGTGQKGPVCPATGALELAGRPFQSPPEGVYPLRTSC